MTFLKNDTHSYVHAHVWLSQSEQSRIGFEPVTLSGGGIPSLCADWSSDCSTLVAKSKPELLDATDVGAKLVEGADEVAKVTVGTGGVAIREKSWKLKLAKTPGA